MSGAISRDAKVGVLLGGMSSERKVSLKSGEAVLGALRRRGWNAEAIDVGPDLPSKLRERRIDVAWIVLHGAFGEDGCIQGLLEIMRIPYTGSAVRPSAASMDKIVTKRLLSGTSIRLPEDAVYTVGGTVPEDLRFPVVAKTPNGGSTIGIRLCRNATELAAALEELVRMGDRVLLEEYVEGEEITVAVLDGHVLPVVKIVPESGFFDFEAKYTKGMTRYEVPAELDEEVARQAQEDALTSYRILGLSGIARADFIVPEQGGRPAFLEINTIPGMTATSLSPMAAAATGIPFDELVERVLLGAALHVQVEAFGTSEPSP